MVNWHAGSSSAPMMTASSSSFALHPASSGALHPASSGALHHNMQSALSLQHLNGHAEHGMLSNASSASIRDRWDPQQIGYLSITLAAHETLPLAALLISTRLTVSTTQSCIDELQMLAELCRTAYTRDTPLSLVLSLIWSVCRITLSCLVTVQRMHRPGSDKCLLKKRLA